MGIILEKENKQLTREDRLSARKEKEMTTAQKIAQRNSTEEELIAWLEAKDPEELRQFLTSPWVASLLSDEAIRELYEKIRQQEVSPFAGAAEGYNIEIGMD